MHSIGVKLTKLISYDSPFRPPTTKEDFANISYFTGDIYELPFQSTVYTPEVLSAFGIPAYNTTTNLFFLNLGQKGEYIERQVYSIWDLLGDCGGFRDGILIVLGSLFTPLNSQMFSRDLHKSLFRVTD